MEIKMTITMTFDDYFQYEVVRKTMNNLHEVLKEKDYTKLTSEEQALYDFSMSFLHLTPQEKE